MTQKTDFTEQEWKDLLQAPVTAGTYIMISDISVMAMPKEMKGMFKAIMTQSAPAAAQQLVASVVADLTAKVEQKEKFEQPQLESKEDPGQEVLNLLKQQIAILDEKATPEEKVGFCAWLMQVAQATAEAGREGGFLGIGSTRVSDREKAALDELKNVFGLN